MGAYRDEQWIPVELERVFSFFSDPQNLPRIMPPELAARVERIEVPAAPSAGQPASLIEDGKEAEAPAEGACSTASHFDASAAEKTEPLATPAGTSILISFRPLPFLPLRMHWQARIVSYTPQKEFQDVQVHGPFADWHHAHGFREESRGGQRGTLITDHVRFRAGWGWLGRLLEPMIERSIGRAFSHRQAQVERLLLEGARHKE